MARQVMQRLVNELEQEGLVQLRDNPDHKTSKLVKLTERGRKVLEGMMERERRFGESVFADIGERDVATALKVTTLLCERLADQSTMQFAEDIASPRARRHRQRGP